MFIPYFEDVITLTLSEIIVFLLQTALAARL